jgi:hypothetical protein
MRRHHDDESFDERCVLRDGQRLRVPLTMMDGIDPVQNAIARESLRVTDGAGGTVGLHRPGFRIAADDARKRTAHYDPKGRMRGYSETEIDKEEDEESTKRKTSDAICDAYADYERDLATAWRGSHADAATERTCPDCDGTGVVAYGAEQCKTCSGTGTVPADYEESAEDAELNAETHHEGLGRNQRRVDHRTIEQRMRDHQNKMTDIYDKLDHELSEKWSRS